MAGDVKIGSSIERSPQRQPRPTELRSQVVHACCRCVRVRRRHDDLFALAASMSPEQTVALAGVRQVTLVRVSALSVYRTGLMTFSSSARVVRPVIILIEINSAIPVPDGTSILGETINVMTLGGLARRRGLGMTGIVTIENTNYPEWQGSNRAIFGRCPTDHCTGVRHAALALHRLVPMFQLGGRCGLPVPTAGRSCRSSIASSVFRQISGMRARPE